MTSVTPTVSVIIPCRNEKDFIAGCLGGLTSQDCSESLEFLVAEGASTDGTREIVMQWQARDSRIKIIDNPECMVSTGLNRAIRAASGEIIVRADVHTTYANDYLAECIRALHETEADNVGGPWRASGAGRVQRAVACAFQSPFSTGGSRSHSLDFEGSVDSVYLGCWWRSTLVDLGLFDEELIRNQDDELNLRIIRTGGTVWQTPRIRSTYFPRPSLRGLFRQYFQYGYWKIRVMQKHRRPASWRHVAPGVALLFGFGLFMAGLLYKPLMFVFALCLLFYTAINAAASFRAGLEAGEWQLIPLLPIVFALFHSGYAVGSLKGVFDFMLLRRGASRSMAELTR